MRGNGAKVIRLFAVGSKFQPRCYNAGNMSPISAVIDDRQMRLANFKRQ